MDLENKYFIDLCTLNKCVESLKHGDFKRFALNQIIVLCDGSNTLWEISEVRLSMQMPNFSKIKFEHEEFIFKDLSERLKHEYKLKIKQEFPEVDFMDSIYLRYPDEWEAFIGRNFVLVLSDKHRRERSLGLDLREFSIYRTIYLLREKEGTYKYQSSFKPNWDFNND